MFDMKVACVLYCYNRYYSLIEVRENKGNVGKTAGRTYVQIQLMAQLTTQNLLLHLPS